MNKQLLIILLICIFSEFTFSQSNGDVNLQSGVGIIIENGVTLTVEGNLDLQSNSTSFSSIVVQGSINVLGDTKYYRHVNSQDNRNDLVSSPLANQSWTSFLLNDSGYNADNLFNDGTSAPNTIFLFGPFEKGTTDDYIVYNYSDIVTLTSGTGYRVATNTPQAVSNGVPLIFTGPITETDVNVNIYNEVSGNYYEWNLIGNPYPAYLDVNAFFNHEVSPGITNLSLLKNNSAAIYGYDANNSDPSGSYWTITNLLEGPDYIAPGQGFFVSSQNATANLQFTQDMLVMGSSDDFIANRNSQSNPFLKLKASDQNNSSVTSIYFNNNTSLGLDPGYDAMLFGAFATDFAFYSHLVEDNEGFPMAIQCFNKAVLNDVIVPLGLNANQGTNMTIEILESNLPPATDVYLEDTLLNTFTLLTDSNYNINSNADLSGTGRFYLRFTDSTLGIANNPLDAINIYSIHDQKTVMIQGQLDPKSNLKIIDIQGRTVLNKVLNYNTTTQIIDVSNLSTGIYVVQLKNNNFYKTQKIVIK